jgi:DNA-binding beta-propeller fold protein YncE
MLNRPLHGILITGMCFLIVACGAPGDTPEQFTSDIMVAHKGINSVGFYSAGGEHLKTIDIGPNPHEMVISVDRTLAYITNTGVMRWDETVPGGNTVSIVDLMTREKIGEISTGEFRRPHGIDLDPSTGLIAVTCEYPDRLLLIDPNTRKVIRDFETGGTVSHNVRLDYGAHRAFVSSITSDTVGVVDLSTGDVTVIPTGDSPMDAVLSLDGSELYVACADGARIIDLGTMTDIGTIGSAGGSRIDITSDGTTLIIGGNDGTVEFIDPMSRTILGSVKLPNYLFSMGISQDERFAFTADEPNNRVYILSIADRKLVRTIIPVENAHPDPVWDVPTP